MYMRDFIKKYKRIITILAPVACGVLYLILCFNNIRNAIWFDESYSAYLIRFNPAKIIELTAVDVHPPLYYLLLKGWSAIFGYSDFALRAMSALLGAIAILFAFLWLKYKYGRSAACLGALFLALSPNLVRYGVEMRMYTLVVAIVFAATYVLQLAIDNGDKKWWVIYAILLALGMYTHYFSAFAWVAHVIYLCTVYKKKVFSKKIISTYLGAVVLFLPWVPGLWQQTKSVQGGFWIGDATLYKISDYLGELFFYIRGNEVANWMIPLFMLVAGIVIVLSVRYRKKLHLLLIMNIVPVLVLLLASMPPLTSMFVPRYVLYSMASLAMLYAVDLVFLWRELSAKYAKKIKKNEKPRRRATVAYIAAAVVLLGSSIIGVTNVYAKKNHNFETQTTPVSKQVFQEAITLDNGENLPIISSGVWIYYDLSFYTSNEHPVYFLDESTEYEYGSLEPLRQTNFENFGKIEDLDAFLAEHERFIYVGQPSKGEKLEFVREGYLAEQSLTSAADDLTGNKFQIILFAKEN